MNWTAIHEPLTAAGAAALLFLLFAAVVLAARLLAYRTASVDSSDDEELAGFSLVRYEPMAKLLSEEDFEFLSSQPGYRPEIGARFKKDRRRVFRMYLHELAADFHRLHASARKMVSESPEADSARVGALMRQQITFWRTMLVIEVRLLVPGSSNVLANVDVRGLVNAMEAMRLDLANLAAAQSA
jgi:hypothetical protein